MTTNTECPTEMLRTSIDTEDGETLHIADRVDVHGPITVRFKFAFACPMGGAGGVWLRSTRRPDTTH